MKIKLLGTGSAEGWPGLFCACDICCRLREVGGKNLRTRSSALIDGVLKLDLPPDTLHHVIAHGLDLTKVENLVFTHGHDDHFAVRELQYMSWMFVPHEIKNPLTVVAPADMIARIRHDLDLSILPMRMRCLDPWELSEVGKYLITPVVAQHDPNLICFNYLIHDGERTILYATDTGWYNESTWERLARVKIDAAVIECGRGLDEEGYQGHMSIPGVIRMRQRLIDMGALEPGATVVTTHLSHLCGMLHDELEAVFAPHNILVGFDGMELTI